MLPKNRRIAKNYFPSILSNSKRYNSPHLLLYLFPLDSSIKSNHSRFSFSISKKVSPLATDRNKYRRRGYSVISKHLNQIKGGYFYFFSFRKGGWPINYADLEKEIKELLYKSGMLI